MTTPNNNGWGEPPAPAGGQPSGGYGAPQYGAPAGDQPQYGAPQYGQYGQAGGGPTGFGHFQAAQKPGIIALRPLRVGEFLDGAFGALRFNPKVMLGLTAAVIAVMIALASVVTVWLTTMFESTLRNLLGFEVAGDSVDGDYMDTVAGIQLNVSSYGTSILMILVLPLITGILITAVSRAVIGQKVSTAQVWELTRSKLGWLILLMFLISLVELLAMGVGFVIVFGAAVLVNGWLAVALGLILGVALVVGIGWFTVRTLLIAPVLVLEDASFSVAVTRGWKLTRGSFWRLLGIYLLTAVITSVVSGIVVGPATVIAMVVGMVMSTGGAVTALTIAGIGTTLAYTITTSFTAAVVALLYIDVRMRREGLDVELAAAARRGA